MFDIKLDLFNPNIIFEPSLDKAKVNNFFDMTTAILDDIYEITNLGRWSSDYFNKKIYN